MFDMHVLVLSGCLSGLLEISVLISIYVYCTRCPTYCASCPCCIGLIDCRHGLSVYTWVFT